MHYRGLVLLALLGLVAVSGCTDQAPESSAIDSVDFTSVLNSSGLENKDFSHSDMENVSGFFNNSLIIDVSSMRFESAGKNISMRVMVFENSSVAESQLEKVLEERLTPERGQSKDIKGTTVIEGETGFSYGDSISRESDMVYSVEVVSDDRNEAFDEAPRIRRELGEEVREIEVQRNLTQGFEANTETLALYLGDLSAADRINTSDYSLVGPYGSVSGPENVSEQTERIFVAEDNTQPWAVISTVKRFESVQLAREHVSSWKENVGENYTVEGYRPFEGFPGISVENPSYKLSFRPEEGSSKKNVMIIGRKQDVTFSVVVSSDRFDERSAEQLFRSRALVLHRYSDY